MAGTMKQMPPAMSPGHPARRKPRWIAISVEFGPGIRFVAPRRSTNCSSLSQRRRRTTSSRIVAMCAAGPQRAIVPSLRKSQATSRIGGRLAGMAEDAKRSHRLQLIFGMLGLAVTGAYFVVILFAGLGPRVARWAGGLSDTLVWRVAAVAAAIAIGQALVTFPLAWLRGYWLPRRHGLLHQTLGAWLRDRLKAALIGGAPGLVTVEIVYALMATTPPSVLALWLGDVLLRAGANWWGWQAPWDPAGLPWLVIVVGTLGLVTAPFVNAVSRRVERQADDFALELTGDATAFIGAMERLADLNLAERKPHRLKELLLYSHPSIERRILAATASRSRAG